MLFAGLLVEATNSNDTIINDFAPDATAGKAVAGGATNEAGTLLARAIDWLSYVSIGIAILAIILVGIYIITNVASNNGGAAAGNLRKVLWVLGGLVVIFNAPQIVSLVI